MEATYNDITLTHADEFCEGEDWREQKWLIKDLLIDSGVCILAGSPKHGKTWFALQMAIAVARGIDFLNHETVYGKAIVFSPEGSRAEFKRRIERLKNIYGHDPRFLFYVMDKPDLNLNNPQDQESIESLVEAERPKLIVFDPLSDCFEGDENSSRDITATGKFLKRLGKNYGVTSLLTHHVRVNRSESVLRSMRGSSALEAIIDSGVGVNLDKKGQPYLETLQRHAKSYPCLHWLKPLDGGGWELGEAPQAEEVERDLGEKIVALLRDNGEPMKTGDIRQAIGGDYAKYPAALAKLVAVEMVYREKNGRTNWYSLPEWDVAKEPVKQAEVAKPEEDKEEK